VRPPLHNLMDRALIAVEGEHDGLVRSEEIHELCRIHTVRVELRREQLRREGLGHEARIAVRLLTVLNPDSYQIRLKCWIKDFLEGRAAPPNLPAFSQPSTGFGIRCSSPSVCLCVGYSANALRTTAASSHCSRSAGQLIGDLLDDRLRGALVGLRCVRLVVGLLDLRQRQSGLQRHARLVGSSQQQLTHSCTARIPCSTH
jgi:hypothetical protein